MTSVEVLEAWVSSGKANTVSDKVNGVIRVGLGLFEQC
jgi:hypothetical protein